MQIHPIWLMRTLSFAAPYQDYESTQPLFTFISSSEFWQSGYRAIDTKHCIQCMVHLPSQTIFTLPSNARRALILSSSSQARFFLKRKPTKNAERKFTSDLLESLSAHCKELVFFLLTKIIKSYLWKEKPTMHPHTFPRNDYWPEHNPTSPS